MKTIEEKVLGIDLARTSVATAPAAALSRWNPPQATVGSL
jgi:hypothetical protein